MELILTHPNADFDAAAAALAAHKLFPEAIPVLPERLNRNVEHFMLLYRNGLNFVSETDLKIHDLKRVILVDTQRLPRMKGLKANTPQMIFDHHPPYHSRPNYLSEIIGATTTLLVERIQAANITLTSLEATLLALGIYEDTGSLSYGTTTPRDIRAAAWLLEQHAALDTVRRFLTPPLSDEQKNLLEILLQNTENRVIHGQSITICTAAIDHRVDQVASVAHQLRDMLESSAIFLVVAMPESLLLVCRSADDTLDVGEIARTFGGGGHKRAASATIYDKSISEVVPLLWAAITGRVRPTVRVSDLMSYGVQTVAADQRASAIVQQLRRIGHEGFPVIEAGQVVGLLTRRELDRTIEHNLGDLLIRDIMTSGQVILHPDDPVSALEQLMVESGWGQIPVIDSQERLIGIVTRTDLIKHWAAIHPTSTPAPVRRFTPEHVQAVLGSDTTALIQIVAQYAQASSSSLYLVGGVVRDLLLERANDDIDFVVEQNAIHFARQLHNELGGDIHSYQPFGTAKWLVNESLAQKLGLDIGALPPHIDFATARNEFYEHPTALPTVYQSGIKMDLQRRDFTINTLAIQLSPEAAAGRVLDFYGGESDLHAGLIRVLHSLSFVDDPTRILRAMRFKRRLGFTIEPRTMELIETALPMLRRITGERVRNEIDLLLSEPQPEHALLELEAHGILTAIHPAFILPAGLAQRFERLRSTQPPWQTAPTTDLPLLYWHALLCDLTPADLQNLAERLQIAKRLQESLLDAAALLSSRQLTGPDVSPSAVVSQLENVGEMAQRAVWLVSTDPLVSERIQRYQQVWQHIHPVTTGADLKALGIRPGPCYGRLLRRLRNALLEGAQDEQQLLRKWLDEGICDDLD